MNALRWETRNVASQVEVVDRPGCRRFEAARCEGLHTGTRTPGARQARRWVVPFGWPLVYRGRRSFRATGARGADAIADNAGTPGGNARGGAPARARAPDAPGAGARVPGDADDRRPRGTACS